MREGVGVSSRTCPHLLSIDVFCSLSWSFLTPFVATVDRRIVAVLALVTRAKRRADCVQSWLPSQGRPPAFSCYILTLESSAC